MASFGERRPFCLNTKLCYKNEAMRLIRILLLAVFIFSIVPGSISAQTPTPPIAVRVILNSMTPEERVGQLFLVTFSGLNTGTDSQIYDLITKHHVGGVVLLSENDNFSGTDTLVRTHQLIDELQQIEWDNSSSAVTDPLTGNPIRYVYVPLFVGV